jgi:hypothetical protein
MSFWIVLAALSLKSSEAATSSYTDSICQDQNKIAQEYIDAELAGSRWQGSDEEDVPCLKDFHPKTMKLELTPHGEAYFLNPEYLVSDPKKVTFTLKKLPDDLLEVQLTYQAYTPKNKKETTVHDAFTLQLNSGKARTLRGCASFESEPKLFVMRSQCWKALSD